MLTTEREILDFMEIHVGAMCAHLDYAITCDDKEMLDATIDALQITANLLHKEIPKLAKHDIRQCIREAHGDYAAISDKCIRLGLV